MLNSHRKRKQINSDQIEDRSWAESCRVLDVAYDEPVFNVDEIRECLKQGMLKHLFLQWES